MKVTITRNRKLQIEGHKLDARGCCECGWCYKGWIARMSSIHRGHQNHLRRVLDEHRRNGV